MMKLKVKSKPKPTVEPIVEPRPEIAALQRVTDALGRLRTLLDERERYTLQFLELEFDRHQGWLDGKGRVALRGAIDRLREAYKDDEAKLESL
jgi:hypothetical protein